MISLINVSKHYIVGETSLKVLDAVDLELKSGSINVISAPSGSGKSTVLNLIGCLDVPDSGKIKLDGEDVSNFTDYQLATLRNHKIGFVFQVFHLIPVLTVCENVAYPLALQKVNRKERMAKANIMLKLVGLADHSHKKPQQLSGGQRQRVAIARALVTRPKIILADEPTANLDEVTASEIISLMVRLNREHQTTLLISTHDPQVAKFADRCLTLKDRKIVDLDDE